jgi:single stranded DNA-binding protein (ssb)
MNKLTIIGNLTRDPELRTTPNGINVCDFTVAVNRRNRRDDQNGQPEADFFRVTAWRQLGENCARFLAKGRKVCVVGPVSARSYTANDGTTRVSLEVTADDVEFLSPRGESEGAGSYAAPAAAPASSSESQAAGFTAVETDELPF